jgi:gliding motility-associated lipoprotein GldH
MKKIAFVTFLSLCALIFTSCGSKVLYEKMDAIPNEIWNMDSALTYKFDITDSAQYYDIYINVRNNTDYETQYFYIFLNTIFPSGYIGKDTLGCVLCDPYGVWKGKGSGRMKDNHFLFKSKVRFNQKGSYTFKIYQAMRSENLKGISHFGVSISEFDASKYAKKQKRK